MKGCEPPRGASSLWGGSSGVTNGSTATPTIEEIEQERVQLKVQLRSVANSLREIGAVTNGYDAAYYLEPAPPDFPAANIHDTFFRQRQRYLATSLTIPARPGSSDAAPRLNLINKSLVRLVEPNEDECEDKSNDNNISCTTKEWHMLPLGRCKCETIWKRFDYDQDDLWSFEEFREYVLELDFKQQHSRVFSLDMLLQHPETWSCAMNDLFDATDEATGRMTFEGFVRFRESIEDECPLAYDLATLGMPMEYPGVLLQRHHRKLFDEYAEEEGDQGQGKEEVSFERAQFLFGESGIYLSLDELEQVLEHQRMLQRCLHWIRGLKRSLRLFGYFQKSQIKPPSFKSKLPREEISVSRAGFLALRLSGYAPIPRTPWRAFAIKLRMKLYELIRRSKRFCRSLKEWVDQVEPMGLLHESCLMSSGASGSTGGSRNSRIPVVDRGDYTIKMDIGPNFSSHSSVHITYNSDADSAGTLHALKYLQPEAECFIYFDFLCRIGLKENEVEQTRSQLFTLLNTFFDDHLKQLPFFHSWFVSIPTKQQLAVGTGGFAGGGTGGGGASTSGSASGAGGAGGANATSSIRVVLLFTKQMDLYEVMQSLHLPSSMQFDHFVESFSLRMLFNVSLEKLVNDKRFLVGNQLACRMLLNCRINRKAFSWIWKQIVLQMDAERQISRETQEFLQQQKRTGTTNQSQEPGTDHESGTNQGTPNGAPAPPHQQYQAAAAAPTTTKHNTKRPVLKSHAPDPVMLHWRFLQQVEEQKWLQWRKQMLQKAQGLESSREITAMWTFGSLVELFLKNSLVSNWFSMPTLAKVKKYLTTPGSIATGLKETAEKVRLELGRSKYFRRLGLLRTPSSAVDQQSPPSRLSRQPTMRRMPSSAMNALAESLLAQQESATTIARRNSGGPQPEIADSNEEQSPSMFNADQEQKPPSRRLLVRRSTRRTFSGFSQSSDASQQQPQSAQEEPERSPSRPHLTRRSSMHSVKESSNAESISSTVKMDEENELLVLGIYETLTRNLVTCTVIHAEAGTTGVTMTMEGMNLVSLFPTLRDFIPRRSTYATKTPAGSSGSGS